VSFDTRTEPPVGSDPVKRRVFEMARDEAGFRAYVEPMVMDGYLDIGEERDSMMQASRFGLSGEEAQQILVSMCQTLGAVLERLAIREFREHIKAAVGDKYLDDGELQELQQAGLDKFKDAENPSELVDRLIGEVLRLEGAYTETALRDETRSQLQPYKAQGTRIRKADWEQIKAGAFARLRAAGVDLEENDDIGDKLEEWLVAAGLTVGGGGKGGIALTLLLLILLVVVIAIVAVVAVPRLSGDGGGGGGGTSIGGGGGGRSSGTTACDAACDGELRQLFQNVQGAAENLRYTTPAGDCVKKWYGDLRVRCEPFDALTPAKQRAALERYEGWGWCEKEGIGDVLGKVKDDYLRWAEEARSGSPVSRCEWLRRCLEAMPGNEPCAEARSKYSCR
jgi:hypothetical protein